MAAVNPGDTDYPLVVTGNGEGSGINRTLGGAMLAVAAVASLGVTAFWPGVACNSNAEVDASRQAKERALGRHRLEAISNYIETQRKIERRRKYEEQRKAAEKRKETITPAEQTAFRASAVIGVWQRFVAGPYKESKGKLNSQQAKLAALAVRKLHSRVTALAGSAKQAGLTDIAAAASKLEATLPEYDTTVGSGTLDQELFDRANDLVEQIRAGALAAKLPVLPTVPADFAKG